MINVSKERKVEDMFKKTEVDESIRWMGDLAKVTLLQLKAGIYIRGDYGDVIKKWSEQNTHMGDRIETIKDFIYGKTNWRPVVMYSDINGITYDDYEPEYLELPSLRRQISLNALLRSIENNDIKIDVLIIDDLSQISRDIEIVKEVCNKLIANQVIVFCLNTKDVFAIESLVYQKMLADPFLLNNWNS